MENLRICLINKSDSQGGAAVACKRLFVALQKNDVDAKLVVQKKQNNEAFVYETDTNFLKRKMSFLNFVAERLFFLPYESSKLIRFAFSPANFGESIHRNKNIKSADVFHLHWFNQGFLSLKSIENIFKLKKPVVWTLHDMWAFTGGCHYAGECTNFTKSCGNCIFLKKPDQNDLSNKIFEQKKKMLHNANLTLVTCSNWLKGEAQKSSLLKNFRIETIPNPIDTEVFSLKNKSRTKTDFGINKDNFTILFGAANINDPRKGFQFLIEALKILKEKHSNFANSIELMVFGKSDNANLQNIGFKVNSFSYLNSMATISQLYSAADVFILPSLEDNLPNTVMEALSCGTPVVAFNTGGIPDMIDHLKNGYLAEYKSATDLATGIFSILTSQNYQQFSQAARKKVLDNFTEKIVANKYKSLYRSLL